MDDFESIVSEISLPLLRRLSAGRAGFVLVAHQETRAPENVVEGCRVSFERDRRAVQTFDFAELGRNPVEVLVRSNRNSPGTIFFVRFPRDVLDKFNVKSMDALRALNLHREVFKEECISAVFWLHVSDLAMLHEKASNFLEFCIRAIEIPSEHEEERTASRRFLVALSFPNDYRSFVRSVAERLGAALGRERVFYDEWYEAEIARINLDTHLQAIYHGESELVVLFLGRDYEREAWYHGVEWRAIRAGLTQGSGDNPRLITMRFDDTPVPAFLQQYSFIDIRDRSPRTIADLLLERLALRGIRGGSDASEA